MTRVSKSAACWCFALILAGSALLYFSAPGATRNGIWTHSVLRNWQEYGWRESGGRMISNPGGFEALEHPQIYTGHRAGTLTLAYLVESLFGSVGENNFPFFALFSLVVALATWRFLGGGAAALLVAGAVVTSAGFLRTSLILDPLTIPVLLGVAAMHWIVRWLAAETIAWPRIAALFLLIALYSALNWTTAFTYAVTFAYVLVALRARPGRCVLFTLLAGAGVAVVGGVSLLDKMHGGATGGPSLGFQHFFNAYLFGSGGYQNYPMNWSKAILRIGSANLIALLPLVALYAWLHYRAARRAGRFQWLALAPLLMAALTIGGMRNYFAHHPWMAASVVIIGIIFSTRLLLDAPAGTAGSPLASWSPPIIRQVLFVVLCLAYGCVVTLFLRVNSAGEESLRKLVRGHSARHDLIVVAADQDPLLAQNIVRLEEMFDRHIVLAPDAKSAPEARPSGTNAAFRLTAAQPAAAGGWLARSERDDSLAHTLASKPLGWYRRFIARRANSDRLEFGATYYLYKMPE